MGVGVEAFEQALALLRGEAVAVEQRGGGLQGVGFLAVEDFVPVEAQEAVVRPLVAVEQQPLGQADEEDVARRMVGPEEGVGENVGPGGLGGKG